MKTVRCKWIGALAVAAVALASLATVQTQAKDSKEPAMLAHNVFFSLQDSTPENRQTLLNACHTLLADHPGTVLFAVGTPSDLDRPVNDRDFDVGLHLVFKDRAAHDVYQTAPKHLQFVEENKHLWKKVRVFDSDVTGAAK